MGRLNNKVAFITGSGAGIGKAAALLFSSEGAKIVVAEISSRRGKDTVKEIKDNGGDGIFIETDVKDEISVINAFGKVSEEYGKIDILYNNAGYSVPNDGTLLDININDWDETQNVNLRGTFLCCKYGMPLIIQNGGGSVILTASIFGLMGCERSAYTAAKGGIISLTRVLAVDYAEYNVRVNCICPGVVLTAAVKSQLTKNEHVAKSLKPKHLLGFCEPVDIAYSSLFLASDESTKITGAILPVDSGFTAAGKNFFGES